MGGGVEFRPVEDSQENEVKGVEIQLVILPDVLPCACTAQAL